jgi:hypothetical protein
MQLQDLYKLVHQASMGSEHAVSDTAAARTWLENELRELDSGPSDPFLEPLTPDSALVRVHLRPYRDSGGDPNRLLQAFVNTANGYRGSTGNLIRLWSTAETLASEGKLPFTPEDMSAFVRRLDSLGFPAVHHSEAYTAAYRPAYRVVARNFLSGAEASADR